jgi:hypothetical protein
MKRVVFISHSSADRAVAERACAYLEKNGVACWMAPRDVTPGKNYGAAIIDAIDECEVFVLVLSSQSNKSRQVVREVERAASTDSVILPFRIEDVQPSRDIAFYVSAAHWLDAVKEPVDEQFDELLTAIRNWQTTETSGEQAALPSPQPQPAVPVSLPSAQVSPKAPGTFPWWWLLIGIAGIIAVAGTWIAMQLMNPGRQASRGAAVAENPSPVATPAATPTPEPKPPTPSPTPIETPTPTPAVVITASPIRLKPGERLRPATTPESGAEVLPTTPPMTLNTPASPPVPKGPIVREIAASSQLNSEFRPNLAFDGNPSTAWVPKGRAIGQSLFVNFKAPAVIRSVSILNGDGRDEEHYQESNRVRSLRIILSDGTNQLLTFKDEMKMQRFELQKPVTASWVKFEIVSVYPGTKIKHAAISEIAFNEDEH